MGVSLNLSLSGRGTTGSLPTPGTASSAASQRRGGAGTEQDLRAPRADRDPASERTRSARTTDAQEKDPTSDASPAASDDFSAALESALGTVATTVTGAPAVASVLVNPSALPTSIAGTIPPTDSDALAATGTRTRALSDTDVARLSAQPGGLLAAVAKAPEAVTTTVTSSEAPSDRPLSTATALAPALAGTADTDATGAGPGAPAGALPSPAPTSEGGGDAPAPSPMIAAGSTTSAASDRSGAGSPGPDQEQAGSPAAPAAPAATAAPAFGVTSAPLPTDAPMAARATEATVRQVFPDVTRFAQSAAPGTHRLAITLHPEDLGEVKVTLIVRAGTLQVQLSSDTPATRAALADGRSELHRMLELAGPADTRIVVRDVSGAAIDTRTGSSSQQGPQTQAGAEDRDPNQNGPGQNGSSAQSGSGRDGQGPNAQAWSADLDPATRRLLGTAEATRPTPATGSAAPTITTTTIPGRLDRLM